MARQEFTRLTQDFALGRQAALCGMCGTDFRRDGIPNFHHVLPCNCGGSNNLDNCVVLCKECHYAAHNYGNYRQPLELLRKEFPFFNGPAVSSFGKGRRR